MQGGERAAAVTALGQPDACAQLGRGRQAEGADALKGLAFTELPLQGACRSQIQPFIPASLSGDVVLASLWNAHHAHTVGAKWGWYQGSWAEEKVLKAMA